jgi:anti-sigma-K factor RskA
MPDEHTPFLENIPAYAIGALDAEETTALEAHLSTCETCRGELAAYGAVSDNLLLATQPQQPPASLRRRLRGQLPSAQRRERGRGSWSLGQWALGIAVLLLLALNLYAFSQMLGLREQQASLGRQLDNAQAALAMLSYPGTENLSIQSENVAGRLLLDKEQSAAMLVLWGVPPISQDQTYQIWLIDPNGDRTSAGLFRPETEGRFTMQTIPLPQDRSKLSGIGVTVEPAGGSDQPTGPRLFKIDF